MFLTVLRGARPSNASAYGTHPGSSWSFPLPDNRNVFFLVMPSVVQPGHKLLTNTHLIFFLNCLRHGCKEEREVNTAPISPPTLASGANIMVTFCMLSLLRSKGWRCSAFQVPRSWNRCWSVLHITCCLSRGSAASTMRAKDVCRFWLCLCCVWMGQSHSTTFWQADEMHKRLKHMKCWHKKGWPRLRLRTPPSQAAAPGNLWETSAVPRFQNGSPGFKTC